MNLYKIILNFFMIICCFCVHPGNGPKKYAYAGDTYIPGAHPELSLELRTKIKHDKSPVQLSLFPQWLGFIISAGPKDIPVAVNACDYLSEDGGRVILPLNTELLLYNSTLSIMNFPLEFDLDVKNKNSEIDIFLNDEVVKKNVNSTPENKICMLALYPGLNMVSFNQKISQSNYSLEKNKGKIVIEANRFDEPGFEAIPDIAQKENQEGEEKSQDIEVSFKTEFTPDAISVLTGDLSIDLREFPVMDILTDFSQKEETTVLFYLGIDVGMDGVIDGYLQLGYPEGSFNVLDSVYEKWGKKACQGKGAALKKIILLIDNETDKNLGEKDNFFTISNFTVMSQESILLKTNSSIKNTYINNEEKCKGDETVLNVFPYWLPGTEGKYPRKVWGVAHIKCNRDPLRGSCEFSFKYKIEDTKLQAFNVYSLIKDGNRVEKKLIFNSKLEKKQGIISVDAGNQLSKRNILQEVLIDCVLVENSETQSPLSFVLSSFCFYEKVPYPLNSSNYKKRFLTVLKEKNPELVQIGEERLSLDAFAGIDSIVKGEGVLSKSLSYSQGEYPCRIIDNDVISVERVLLSLKKNKGIDSSSKPASVSFKKISPVKYAVKITEISEPFFLVFTETYHDQWQLFPAKSHKYLKDKTRAFKPGAALLRGRDVFKISDVKFLFESSMAIPHIRINAFANGWYIDPRSLGGATEADFVLFFLPQSSFCLGLIFSVFVGILAAVFFVLKLWRFPRSRT